MTGIQCPKEHVFVMCDDNFIDAEWKLQECYYMSQGCEIVKEENLKFSTHDDFCPYCSMLEHKFEELIEEIRGEKD